MKTYFDQMSFNDEVYKRLNKLIATYGKDSPSYDPENKPFAAFDWDNTSIIGDVEEALLYYMVTELAFKMDPFDFDRVMRLNVDEEDFPEGFTNMDGKPINIGKLSKDIKAAYKKLYKTAVPLGGDVPMEEIKKTNIYKGFVAKVFFRYQAARVDPNAWDMYCWMGFLLTNYKASDIRDLCSRAFTQMKKEPLRDEVFRSPDIESQAGRVELSYFVGLREVPEMAKLYRALEDNGIEAYVVSASVIDIVGAFATSADNIYRLDEDRVLGLRLTKDGAGRIRPALDRSYPPTIRDGKVETIRRYIRDDYGPILTAGDSDGDFNMLTEFPDMKMGLIIDRKVDGDILAIKKGALLGSSTYILQARSRSEGSFIKAERSREEMA